MYVLINIYQENKNKHSIVFKIQNLYSCENLTYFEIYVTNGNELNGEKKL